MGRRISITGWVPEDENETKTLRECSLSAKEIRQTIRGAIPKTKVEAKDLFSFGIKKVRVTVEIDVETLS